MGFRTLKYEINGFVYPEVYAVYETADTKVQPAIASFKIHTTRENALNKEPLERKYVRFNWDRNTNLVSAAYEAGKTKEIDIIDPVTGKLVDTITQIGVFDGWVDNIQKK